MKKFKLALLGFALLPLFSTAQVVGINIGNVAPEISMRNPNDSIIKLSSLRGKVVLIDFWASWCGPCRLENPNVVKTYRKYKDSKFDYGNGFTIYSVALERSNAKSAWTSAIKNDSLYWPYHVTDYQWWSNAAAQEYKVSSIPTNFLIDENGVIIAKGLRGDQLPKLLERIIKKPKAPGSEKPGSSVEDVEKTPAEKPKHPEKTKSTTGILNEKRRNSIGIQG